MNVWVKLNTFHFLSNHRSLNIYEKELEAFRFKNIIQYPTAHSSAQFDSDPGLIKTLRADSGFMFY